VTAPRKWPIVVIFGMYAAVRSELGYVLGAIWSAVLAIRVVLVLIALVVMLLSSGQGEELSASLLIAPAYNDWLLFLSVFAWAAQSWLWARISLELAFDQTSDARAITRHVSSLIVQGAPIVCAIGAFLAAILHFIRAEKFNLVLLIGVCAVALFFALAAWIHNYQRATEMARGQQKNEQGPFKRRSLGALCLLLHIGKADRIRFIWWPQAVIAAYAWCIAWIFIGVRDPILVANGFGTVGTVLLALSVLLPILATAIISTRRANFPTFLTLFLAPFVLPSLYGWIIGFHLWSIVAGGIAVAGILVVLLVRGRPLIAAALLCVVISLSYVAYHRDINVSIPHEVRLFGGTGASAPCPPDMAKRTEANPATGHCRPTIDAEVDSWLRDLNAAYKKSHYIVFVSAAGGGLRAAYWTASILARLSDCISEFDHQLFAISGVSGGSLGAAVYAALARDKRAAKNASPTLAAFSCEDHPLSPSDPSLSKGWMQSQLPQVLEHDFLAPVVANLFFRDLPQAIIPVQLMTDRAVALELAFEQAWEKSCDKRDGKHDNGPPCLARDQFSKSFFLIRENDSWVPILLFNGTHQETGKRIVTSHVQIEQPPFYDTYDFFELAKHDLALSTAVLNSARFPFISPAGALVALTSRETRLLVNVIDGGFFENSGAATLEEAMERTLKQLKKRRQDVKWIPLVIEIINDTGMAETDLERRSNSRQEGEEVPLEISSDNVPQIGFANQLISGAQGLYATRTARGILASKTLNEATIDQLGGRFVQFRLCPRMNPSPPVGWLLTAASLKAMDDLIVGPSQANFQTVDHYFDPVNARGQYLRCFTEVQRQLSRVLQFLRDDSAVAQHPQ
jgi:hypothetical protein